MASTHRIPEHLDEIGQRRRQARRRHHRNHRAGRPQPQRTEAELVRLETALAGTDGVEEVRHFHAQGRPHVQYAYTLPDGRRFCTVGRTEFQCRLRRDEWLEELR